MLTKNKKTYYYNVAFTAANKYLTNISNILSM